MAYQNFIPSVWAEAINRELERDCIFAEDCNREYEGSVKNKGESVTILGVGKPTIKTVAKASRNNDIDAAEEIESSSVVMYIDQERYFNYAVGDIDKAQAEKGLMDALSRESAEGLANAVDTYIAGLAADGKKQYATAPKLVCGTAGSGEKNVLDALDDAITALRLNDVSGSTRIVIDMSWNMYKLFRREYQKLDTDNSEEIKNGKMGMYAGCVVKCSNNGAKDSGGNELIMVRTQKAIAYAQPLTHTEAYRPEKKFSDAVKGFILFGAKIVRPKELVVLNVKY